MVFVESVKGYFRRVVITGLLYKALSVIQTFNESRFRDVSKKYLSDDAPGIEKPKRAVSGGNEAV